MLLWYAYRLNIKAYGADHTLLAPGCYDCYFDDFLKFIQRTGKGSTPWAGKTTVGNNLTPDVVTTAKELATSGSKDDGTRYANAFESHQLFPGKYNMGETAKFHVIFGDIVDNIQECRKHVNDVGIDDEIKAIRQAMTFMHQARQADQASHVIKAVNEKLQVLGYSWVCILLLFLRAILSYMGTR